MALEGFPVRGMQPVNIRQELGIMFGFMAACILTVAVYYIFWQGNFSPFYIIIKRLDNTKRNQ